MKQVVREFKSAKKNGYSAHINGTALGKREQAKIWIGQNHFLFVYLNAQPLVFLYYAVF